jgi:enoyl-CoA hydratase/carnithine racemase
MSWPHRYGSVCYFDQCFLPGIIAPFYFREPMIRAAGFRHAERLLQLGALVNGQEALRLGLVDAVEAEPEKAAIAAAQVWAAVPAAAR